jgi:small multidrug resistance pump
MGLRVAPDLSVDFPRRRLTMRHLKLATISVVFSVSMVLLLTAVGVVLFRESLNGYEVAGIVLALASLVLLMRFA